MSEFKKGIVMSSDRDGVKIKTDDTEINRGDPSLSFKEWDTVEVGTDEDWKFSCIKKTSWEIEQLLHHFDKDFNKMSTQYKRIIYKTIPISCTTNYRIKTRAVAFRSKVLGEYNTSDGLMIAFGDPKDNPLDSTGFLCYSPYPRFTKEQMEKACEKLAKAFEDKIKKNEPPFEYGSDLEFIFDEIQSERNTPSL